MKRVKRIIFWLVTLLAMSVLVACQNTAEPEKLLGFEVASEDTVSIGELYVIPSYQVTDSEGEIYIVKIKVTNSGNAVDVLGGKFLVDLMTDYIVEYSVDFNKEAISKQTVLKVVNNSEPTINIAGLKDYYIAGDTFELPGINISDKAGEVIAPDYKLVYVPDNQVITLGEDDSTVLNKTGEYRLTVTATNSFGYTAEKISVIRVSKPNEVESMDSEAALQSVSAYHRISPFAKLESGYYTGNIGGREGGFFWYTSEYTEMEGVNFGKTGFSSYAHAKIKPLLPKSYYEALNTQGYDTVEIPLFLTDTDKTNLIISRLGGTGTYQAIKGAATDKWIKLSYPMSVFLSRYDEIQKSNSLFFCETGGAHVKIYVAGIFAVKPAALTMNTDFELEEQYYVNDEIDLSAFSAASQPAGIAVKYSIITPDGSIVALNTGKYKVTKAGEYTLVAETNDTDYSYTRLQYSTVVRPEIYIALNETDYIKGENADLSQLNAKVFNRAEQLSGYTFSYSVSFGGVAINVENNKFFAEEFGVYQIAVTAQKSGAETINTVFDVPVAKRKAAAANEVESFDSAYAQETVIAYHRLSPKALLESGYIADGNIGGRTGAFYWFNSAFTELEGANAGQTGLSANTHLRIAPRHGKAHYEALSAQGYTSVDIPLYITDTTKKDLVLTRLGGTGVWQTIKNAPTDKWITLSYPMNVFLSRFDDLSNVTSLFYCETGGTNVKIYVGGIYATRPLTAALKSGFSVNEEYAPSSTVDLTDFEVITTPANVSFDYYVLMPDGTRQSLNGLNAFSPAATGKYTLVAELSDSSYAYQYFERTFNVRQTPAANEVESFDSDLALYKTVAYHRVSPSALLDSGLVSATVGGREGRFFWFSSEFTEQDGSRGLSTDARFRVTPRHNKAYYQGLTGYTSVEVPIYIETTSATDIGNLKIFRLGGAGTPYEPPEVNGNNLKTNQWFTLKIPFSAVFLAQYDLITGSSQTSNLFYIQTGPNNATAPSYVKVYVGGIYLV